MSQSQMKKKFCFKKGIEVIKNEIIVIMIIEKTNEVITSSPSSTDTEFISWI